MYIPRHHAQPDTDALAALIASHALGAWVCQTAGGLVANHVPFHFDRQRGKLVGHVARANPVWREIGNGDPVLVVFRGAQGYISPNWYPGKHETHRRVPTWNYEIVHGHGTIHVHDDEKFVRGVVARLTRRHEADQPQPWKMGDAPADYLAEQLSHIVGIEVRLTRLECKRKLNQHHATFDREGAIRGLEFIGNADLAQAMRDTAKPTL